MKKKIFGIIIDTERLNIYSENLKFYLKNYREIIPANVEIYLIDISNLHLFKKKNIEINIDELQANYFKPKNFKELRNFANENYIIATIKIKETLLNLRLNILINMVCKKKVIINNMGFFVMSNEIRNYTFFEKLNFFFNIKFTYYIYRILSIFNIVIKTDLMITSSGSNIKKFNKGISKIIKDKFKIDISYIKNYYKVNSYFDGIKNKKELDDKYIVFCDSGFDHADRIARDGEIKQLDRDNYYNNLHKFLLDLKNKFDKEVIFCLHPKAEYPHSKNFVKIKKDFLFKKYETEEYIKKSYISIFISSLSLNIAVLLKKNIIVINSKLLGNFYKLRNDVLNNEIKLFQVNIDNDDFMDIEKNEIIKKLNNYQKNYDKFIENNIISNKEENYIYQIRNILNNQYFGQKNI